jgi:molybdopterin-containing oxidoreductase family iron-sulfur binding subunit
MKTIPPPCPEPETVKYWKSIEQLENASEVRPWIEREFPEGASELADGFNRRDFMKLMSASMSLAGVGLLSAGCRKPEQKIYPFSKLPDDYVHGAARYFATAMPTRSGGIPLLVKSNDGRPTKVEGNPDHPISLGATNVFGQASILDLYDPGRSQAVRNGNGISSWDAFLAAFNQQLRGQKKDQGARLRVLTPTVTSPTLAAQLHRVLEQFPRAQWHAWDPINHENEADALKQLFGRVVQPQWNFDRADLIVSLESDFLFSHPASLRYARHFAERRRLWTHDRQTMSRLYVAESSPTITGSVADYRLPASSSKIEAIAQLLLNAVIDRTINGPSSGQADAVTLWIQRAAADLLAHAGRSIIIPGEQQPAAVHALAHCFNSHLGNIGTTVHYTARAESNVPWHSQSIRELTSARAV